MVDSSGGGAGGSGSRHKKYHTLLLTVLIETMASSDNSPNKRKPNNELSNNQDYKVPRATRIPDLVVAANIPTSRHCSDKVPINRLKKHFVEKMMNPDVPLLASWEEYVKMLPLRESDGFTYRIADFPFWAKEEQITQMAILLESGGVDETRSSLPYLSASTHSGKTASILVGFLNSIESDRSKTFTHYFYMAFHNNQGKRFVYLDHPAQKVAEPLSEQQGAHFAFQCVEFLLTHGPLEEQQSFEYAKDPKSLRSVEQSSGRISALLNEKLPEGAVVLFHLDEHRRMNRCPHFRRGAMMAFARCTGARCVATYTDIPLEVSSDGSSQVCRFPVPKPVLDLTQVMDNMPALNMQTLSTCRLEKSRKWATLAFRLGMKISPAMIQYHLQVREKPKEFLAIFNEFRERGDVDSCLKLCHVDFKGDGHTSQKGALRLMLGLEDSELSNLDFRLPALTVSNGLVTGTLNALLQIFDPEYPIYTDGRRRFINTLRQSKSNDDILTATPLEAAFSWSLSCTAAMTQRLSFDGDRFSFPFSPTTLRVGRLFPGSDNTKVEQDLTRKIKLNTLYYVDERGKDKLSHPLCDMFFRTEETDQLVLIDVTGGGKAVTDMKVARLKEPSLFLSRKSWGWC